MNRYVIRHEATGDEAEADSYDAALVAARTLLGDNDDAGMVKVTRSGEVVAFCSIDDGPFGPQMSTLGGRA